MGGAAHKGNPLRDLRRQLRWAWAKLGCRCIFDKHDRKIHEDAHCPVHGVYQVGERGRWTDPFGNEGPLDAEIEFR